MKKLALFFLIVCTNHLATSQINADILKKKVEGIIVLKDGKELTGEFRIPTAKKKEVSFFNKKDEKTPILSDNIKALKIKNDAGGFSTLVYGRVGRYKKSGGEFIVKKLKKKFWILEVVAGKKAKFYIAGNRFKQTKDGNIEAISDGSSRNPPSFNYYAKMEGRDDFPIFIDMWMGGFNLAPNATFKLFGALFFEGKDNMLSEKIKKKEKGYRSKDREQVFLDFNSH